ncbi:hypothetical protein [Lysinibacillus sphaericus]|uniref:hypothetical protein n=1 Tax=Lysinibacillus sphaericus TaxID=1421 RepID=UPI000C1A265C|nr:hypothetical protein [Lysinibacillus sphaericus]PIJ95839.1 hypothetical protein CTN02_22010 [Lysinibacillus sphaericus]
MDIAQEEFPMVLDFYYSLQLVKLIDMYCREHNQLPVIPNWSLRYDWSYGYGWTTENFLFELLEKNFGIKMLYSEEISTEREDDLNNLESKIKQYDSNIKFENYYYIWCLKTPYEFQFSYESGVEKTVHGYRVENETDVIYYESYIIVGASDYEDPESVGVCMSILEKMKEVLPGWNGK